MTGFEKFWAAHFLKPTPDGSRALSEVNVRYVWDAALKHAAEIAEEMAEHKRKVAEEWSEDIKHLYATENFHTASGAASCAAAIAMVIRAET